MSAAGRRIYRGRFAPSPTGPLHFGSLVAAVGSFLDARAHRGEWLLRIEDLDPPREIDGAAADILRTLECFGLHWDGPVIYQSRRADRYEHALRLLEAQKNIYPCACSRRDIRELSAHSDSPHIYPGTCRNGLPPGREARALRLRVPQRHIHFTDRLQGDIQEWLPTGSGDFVVKRADSLFAYQLAVVVDDIEQGITDVVRGADLLSSTPRQLLLYALLGADAPRYLHLPLATDRHGEKLSKQSAANPVHSQPVSATLCAVLRFLGQPLETGAEDAEPAALLRFASEHWRSENLPLAAHLPAPPMAARQ